MKLSDFYKALALALCTCATLASNAQQIKGSVLDENGSGVAYATVGLLKLSDSALLKYAVAATDGSFVIFAPGAGTYRLRLSATGFKDAYSTSFTVSDTGISLPAINLVRQDGRLAGVTVRARRPQVEVRADRTVLNVEGTINAVGSSAIELLRKAPGVLVDRDENLSISGKNGVQVYIDGRPSPLTGSNLTDYLRTLQASDIDAIEILTNPSSRFDAAGNAGIINIRLKKNSALGTNVSVNGGYAIGAYPKYNGGITFNNRNRSTNVFATVNGTRSRNVNFMDLYRIASNTLFDQRSEQGSRNKSLSYKTGVDWFITRKTTAGVTVNGTLTDNEFYNFARTEIGPADGVKEKNLRSDNTNDVTRKQYNINANYRFIDTNGTSLTIDLDKGSFRFTSDQYQPNIYYDASNTNILSTAIYNMLAPSEIDLYSAKADYEKKFLKGKLAIGGKWSSVETDNDFQRFNVYGNSKSLDSLRSNHFIYREKITAGYFNYSRSLKKINFQLGLRLEHTRAEGESAGWLLNNSAYKSYDSSFLRSYLNAFPSAGITYAKNQNHQFGLTFTRRIDRPNYQDLNPFESKLDENTYQKGNINLTPQYTLSYGFTYTYKSKLNIALNYSSVDDIFAQLVDTVEKVKSFLTKKNLASQKIWSLNASLPVRYKFLNIFMNLNTYYTQYEANFGTGRTIDLNIFAANTFAQVSASLGKNYTAEVSGWFNSPSIWQGTFKTKSMGSMDAGLQKSIANGKCNIKVSFSDVLHTLKFDSESNFAGQYLRAKGHWESQQFKLNVTYRFGRSGVKTIRERKTGLEEESKRAAGDGQ